MTRKNVSNRLINLPSDNLVKKNIIDLQMIDMTANDVLEYVIDFVQKPLDKNNKLLIFTPNPEIVVYAKSHPEFQNLLNQAQINLPDGIGITWAASYLGKPLRERITGIDFMLNLCQKSNENPIRIGLLGAGPGIADKTAECLIKKYHNLKIDFVASEWDGKDISVDILFVAFGFPKQEQWIAQNLPKLSVKSAMAVGGSFDYISAEVSRAPYLLRRIGLEWFYRLIRQPWRWKRQLALIEFIALVLQMKLTKH